MPLPEKSEFIRLRTMRRDMNRLIDEITAGQLTGGSGILVSRNPNGTGISVLSQPRYSSETGISDPEDYRGPFTIEADPANSGAFRVVQYVNPWDTVPNVETAGTVLLNGIVYPVAALNNIPVSAAVYLRVAEDAETGTLTVNIVTNSSSSTDYLLGYCRNPIIQIYRGGLVQLFRYWEGNQ